MLIPVRCAAFAVSLLVLASASAPAGGIEPGPPQFVALSVPDAARSAAWYRQAFGLEVLGEVRPPDGGGYVIILSSPTLLLEILQARDARSPGAESIQKPFLTHGVFKVGFQVPDLEAAVASLTKLGANFETRIVDDARHGLRFVLLRDPDGNYLQLFGTPKSPADP